LAAFDRGRIEREGLRVCLIGRPNAGKSSLLNALLGRDRAIVAATPGTTRDTLEEAALSTGLPAVLVDTAGLRDDASIPPSAKAWRAPNARSPPAMWPCSSSTPARPEDEADARTHRRALELAARERPPRRRRAQQVRSSGAAVLSGGIAVSAKTGAGLAALGRAVVAAAEVSPDGDEGETLLAGTRDRDAFASALAELDLQEPRSPRTRTPGKTAPPATCARLMPDWDASSAKALPTRCCMPCSPGSAWANEDLLR